MPSMTFSYRIMVKQRMLYFIVSSRVICLQWERCPEVLLLLSLNFPFVIIRNSYIVWMYNIPTVLWHLVLKKHILGSSFLIFNQVWAYRAMIQWKITDKGNAGLSDSLLFLSSAINWPYEEVWALTRPVLLQKAGSLPHADIHQVGQ